MRRRLSRARRNVRRRALRKAAPFTPEDLATIKAFFDEEMDRLMVDVFKPTPGWIELLAARA